MWHSKYRYYFLFFLLTFLLLFFHTRGILYTDEGYILHNTQRVINGEMPYKDFHFVYTPGSILFAGIAFKIFGTSILVSRLLMLVVSLVTSIAIFYIITTITEKKPYAVIAVLMYVAWGPAHINFAWPIMFCLSTSIFTCLFLLRFLKEKRLILIVIAGICTFLTFLFKQNFGAVVFLNGLLFFLFLKNVKRTQALFTYLFGWGIAFGFFILFLVTSHSFFPFINDLWELTVQRVVINNELDTPFMYPDTLFNMIARTAFYLIPFILSIALATILFMKKKYQYIFIAAFIALFYIAGIRPTTDYVHLVPLLSLTGIPLVLLLYYTTQRYAKLSIGVVCFLLLYLGFYTALFKGYYRWGEPLLAYTLFSNSDRTKIFLTRDLHRVTSSFITTIEEKTTQDDYIFVDYYAPMIYFLTNRKQPASYDSLASSVNQKAYQKEAISSFKEKDVKLVFIDMQQIHRDTPINTFVKKHYVHTQTIGSSMVWEKSGQ